MLSTKVKDIYTHWPRSFTEFTHYQNECLVSLEYLYKYVYSIFFCNSPKLEMYYIMVEWLNKIRFIYKLEYHVAIK